MEFEQSLEILSRAFSQFSGRPLTQIEVALLFGAWNNLTYDRIAERTGYSTNYLQRDIGPKFWKLLSEVLGREVNKTTLRAVVTYLDTQIPNPIRSSDLDEVHPKNPQVETYLPAVVRVSDHAEAHTTTDWGEAPDVSSFYGRTDEIEQLTHCLIQDRCRLVEVLGIGGIGKSALAAKMAWQVQNHFEFVIWRSLRNAPGLETLLAELVPFLSNQQDIQATPERLLHWLQTHRCLVILDNHDTLLQSGELAGIYQPQFTNYGDLLRLLGETNHQSCVLLTSRERSWEVAILEDGQGRGRTPGRRTCASLRLAGSPEATQAILQSKGLIGTPEQKQRLGDRYGHNPLALKIVATSIQSLFDSNISEFLKEDILIFNSIRRLFDQQFQRLSELEKSLMYWLAINREWTTLADLQSDLVPAVPKGKLLGSLEALSFRCLIEQQGTQFTQQPVVMEYVTEQLLDLAATDLQYSTLNFLTTHALLKATAKDYIRETQRRLIVEPLCDRLFSQWHNLDGIFQHIQQHFDQLRRSKHPGYGAGNLINLLCHLKADLRGADFSSLTIRQAYLRETPLHRSNFANSTQIESIFAETMTDIYAMAVSPTGSLIAMTSGKSGMLFIYEATTGKWLHSIKAHNAWILGVAFTATGNRLFTGSLDCTIREWDIRTGHCISTLKTDIPVTNIALSCEKESSNLLLASAHDNGTIQVWDLNTLERIQTLSGHRNTVVTVDFHPYRSWLASSSHVK